MAGISFRDVDIPESELSWSFDTSGGPGGQHANRTASRVTVTFDLAASPSIPPAIKDRLASTLAPRMRDGVVSVVVDDSRSQWRNRAIARERLAALLEEALIPRATRHRTRPSGSVRRRRLAAKRRRSEVKRLRQQPDEDA